MRCNTKLVNWIWMAMGRTMYIFHFVNLDFLAFVPCTVNAPFYSPQAGQKVYLTHNGREISGRVISHNRESDEVLIHVKPTTSDEDGELFRSLEELRLMASRKSARLQDQDTDYSRLADVHSESKKRAVSSVIDVPLPAKQRYVLISYWCIKCHTSNDILEFTSDIPH